MVFLSLVENRLCADWQIVNRCANKISVLTRYLKIKSYTKNGKYDNNNLIGFENEAGKDGRAKNQGLKKWKNLC